MVLKKIGRLICWVERLRLPPVQSVELQPFIGVEVRRGSSAPKNADITMSYARASNLEK
jgi:hypothetical protein